MEEFCVAIKETVIQNFIVEAETPQEAVQKLIESYKKARPSSIKAICVLVKLNVYMVPNRRKMKRLIGRRFKKKKHFNLSGEIKMKEEICVIIIPTPEFVRKVVEVPSAKEEEKMNNVLKEIANSIVSYFSKPLCDNEKPKKEKQAKKSSVEKSINYSTTDLAKKLGCDKRNVSTYIKKFNKRYTDGHIECPGVGVKNVGYNAKECEWAALFNWRKITKRS